MTTSTLPFTFTRYESRNFHEGLREHRRWECGVKGCAGAHAWSWSGANQGLCSCSKSSGLYAPLAVIVHESEHPEAHCFHLGLVITRHVSTDVVVGHDFAGTIEEIGPELPAGLRELGERVAGFVRGGNHTHGCPPRLLTLTYKCVPGFLKETGGSFAEYCVADAQVLVTLPDSLSYEDAAGLGLSGFTACQTLWQNRDIPTPLEPAEEPFPVRPGILVDASNEKLTS